MTLGVTSGCCETVCLDFRILFLFGLGVSFSFVLLLAPVACALSEHSRTVRTGDQQFLFWASLLVLPLICYREIAVTSSSFMQQHRGRGSSHSPVHASFQWDMKMEPQIQQIKQQIIQLLNKKSSYVTQGSLLESFACHFPDLELFNSFFILGHRPLHSDDRLERRGGLQVNSFTVVQSLNAFQFAGELVQFFWEGYRQFVILVTTVFFVFLFHSEC